MTPKSILTKELLETEFVQNKLSIGQIAEKYNIKSKNSVTQAIKRYDLYRESNNGKLKNITREWLYQKYVIEDMSALDIVKLFGLKRRASILNLLKKFEIPIRQTTKTKKFKQYCMDSRTYGEMTSNYFNSIKCGAKARNLEWSITGEDAWNLFLKQNRQCALSGVDLVMCDTCLTKKTQTASLDRVDSSKGYLLSNIQWIHKDLNKMKWNLKQEDFIKWCKIIADRNYT
jgi:predicted DNA-binding protein YlxM (UPF0122 family)